MVRVVDDNIVSSKKVARCDLLRRHPFLKWTTRFFLQRGFGSTAATMAQPVTISGRRNTISSSDRWRRTTWPVSWIGQGSQPTTRVGMLAMSVPDSQVCASRYRAWVTSTLLRMCVKPQRQRTALGIWRRSDASRLRFDVVSAAVR